MLFFKVLDNFWTYNGKMNNLFHLVLHTFQIRKKDTFVLLLYLYLTLSCENDVNFTECIGEKLDGLQKWMKRIWIFKSQIQDPKKQRQDKAKIRQSYLCSCNYKDTAFFKYIYIYTLQISPQYIFAKDMWHACGWLSLRVVVSAVVPTCNCL